MPVRKRSLNRREELGDGGEDWLKWERSDNAFWFECSKSEDELRDIWKQNSERIVAEHVAEFPGTRPYRWWQFEAPRSPKGTYLNRFYDGELPEPRKRLGGIGTPHHEVLGYKPSFAFGIPIGWVDQWQVDYYTGVAVDIHGKRISEHHVGSGFAGVAVDLYDPPTFESEATYLDRHKLFLPGERRRWEAE
jgi:hypothetical protein